jgi:hypothetical protein
VNAHIAHETVRATVRRRDAAAQPGRVFGPVGRDPQMLDRKLKHADVTLRKRNDARIRPAKDGSLEQLASSFGTSTGHSHVS